MFAVIRRYELTDDLSEDVVRSVQDGFIPRLRELDGFVDYYFVDGGDRTIATVSVFESREQAERSNEVAAQYIREDNLADLLPTPPQTTMGEVVAGARLAAMA